jgi:hypothetical protein
MPKKETEKKEVNKVTKSTKKVDTKKTTTAKKTTATKKVTAKKLPTKKATVVKKTTTSKSKTSNIRTKKVTTQKPKVEVVEYYDLPYRYNQTIVKVLYQTPNVLFIYWDISDTDRQNFIKQFGDNFFNDTKPVLIVHNDTMHYAFEIDIDDFANSWYLHINDSNCKYRVELGRRPKNEYSNEVNIPNDYLHVTNSNEIEAPNDHVLFNKNLDTVYFRDVKTNIITKKTITSLSFMRMMGKIYSLYDLQTNFNKDNWMDANHWQLDFSNPSSSNPSSTFK